jgi:hypothetical protein
MNYFKSSTKSFGFASWGHGCSFKNHSFKFSSKTSKRMDCGPHGFTFLTFYFFPSLTLPGGGGGSLQIFERTVFKRTTCRSFQWCFKQTKISVFGFHLKFRFRPISNFISTKYRDQTIYTKKFRGIFSIGKLRLG